MIMSWLTNSMEIDVGQTFLFYKTAKKIWDAAKETFSNNKNAIEVFEIKSQLLDLRQGNLSITQHFNILSWYWQKLDVFKELEWDYASDNIKYQKFVEKERIFTFLAGLNKNREEVRGRTLSTKPLPSLQEACSEVRWEESRKKVMMKYHTSSQSFSSNDGSALATKGPNSQHFDSRRRSNKLWCDHCNRVGHTQETYWKTHGKPFNWKSNRTQENEPRGYRATNDEPPQPNTSANKTPFRREKIELLQTLLTHDPSSTSTIRSSSIAQKGLCSKSLNAFSK